MRSTLVITTPASDLAILTDEEMAALDTTDMTEAQLTALGLSIAADIMSECNVRVGFGGQPTLYQETLTETFYDWPYRHDLTLARRHDVEITSVTQDGASIDATEYIVNAEDGLLARIDNGWWCGKIVVVYKAGFTELPADLHQTALYIFNIRLSQSLNDPTVRSQEIEIPGVERKQTDFLIETALTTGLSSNVPAIVAGRLKRYRNRETSIA